ncbi:hypothetical protein CN367_11800 [Priestia megaterium]|uniref:hypothetical protein n=1 Tax=Priestia megaterium TaxID=1404 RepID=UPI000BF6B4C9|nr:hypothetical protein [Priestia megaterium]PEZ47043.1 hypothetical protein CN367_11800 [Priestia megaterium]
MEKLSMEKFNALVNEMRNLEAKLHEQDRLFYDQLIWELSTEQAEREQERLRDKYCVIEVIRERIAHTAKQLTKEELKEYKKAFNEKYAWTGK